MSKKLLLTRVSMLLILNIGKNENLSSLQRKTGITYSYVLKLIEIFKKEKIVELIKIGRERKISLTPKGIKYKHIVEDLIETSGIEKEI